jgi:hypothetical protein
MLSPSLVAPDLRGQTSSPEPASAALEGSVAISSLRGEANLFVGGAALLGTGGRFAFGGAGWVLTSGVAIPTGTPNSDLQLLVAYGGLLTQLTLLDTQDTDLSLRALLGAGTGRIRLPVVNTEISVDNFGVFEPQLVVLRRLHGVFHVGAGLGYRFSFAVEDLPGIVGGDLSGPSAHVTIHLGNF